MVVSGADPSMREFGGHTERASSVNSGAYRMLYAQTFVYDENHSQEALDIEEGCFAKLTCSLHATLAPILQREGRARPRSMPEGRTKQ